ncbi:MAG: hypothetical protein ACLFQU_04750 [Candidatus Kapaibacterium sp.]
MNFKILIIIISGMLFLSEAAYAQKAPESDSSASLRLNPEFSDADNEGIDDRLSARDSCMGNCGGRHKHHQRAHRRDRFIDKDGDGINDHRCRGMGLFKGRGKGKAAKGNPNQKNQFNNSGK